MFFRELDVQSSFKFRWARMVLYLNYEPLFLRPRTYLTIVFQPSFEGFMMHPRSYTAS